MPADQVDAGISASNRETKEMTVITEDEFTALLNDDEFMTFAGEKHLELHADVQNEHLQDGELSDNEHLLKFLESQR